MSTPAGISFSRSIRRRAARSMSISLTVLVVVGGAVLGVRTAELDLHPTAPDVVPADGPLGEGALARAGHLELELVIGLPHPAEDARAVGQLHLHQAGHVA